MASQSSGKPSLQHFQSRRLTGTSVTFYYNSITLYYSSITVYYNSITLQCHNNCQYGISCCTKN